MVGPPAQSQLVEFSGRLEYTLRLYFRLARSLTRVRIGLASEPAWEVWSAQIESFAMHKRGLADFFYTTKGSRHPHDAFAIHFFDEPAEWSALVGPPGRWLRQVRFRPPKGSPEEGIDRFGEQIAHLNYHALPVSDFARGWPIMQLAAEVGIAASEFCRHVDEARVVPGFKVSVWRELPANAKIGDTTAPLVAWTRPAMREPA